MTGTGTAYDASRDVTFTFDVQAHQTGPETYPGSGQAPASGTVTITDPEKGIIVEPVTLIQCDPYGEQTVNDVGVFGPGDPQQNGITYNLALYDDDQLTTTLLADGTGQPTYQITTGGYVREELPCP